MGSSSLSDQFTLKIATVLSPPTTEDQGSFTVTTMTQDGGSIDRSTNNKVVGLLPKSILNPEISLESYENDVVTKATIGLTIRSYISSTDSIFLIIPSELSINPLTKITIQGLQIASFSVTDDTTHY